jgi:hypothetical protein
VWSLCYACMFQQFDALAKDRMTVSCALLDCGLEYSETQTERQRERAYLQTFTNSAVRRNTQDSLFGIAVTQESQSSFYVHLDVLFNPQGCIHIYEATPTK